MSYFEGSQSLKGQSPVGARSLMGGQLRQRRGHASRGAGGRNAAPPSWGVRAGELPPSPGPWVSGSRSTEQPGRGRALARKRGHRAVEGQRLPGLPPRRQRSQGDHGFWQLLGSRPRLEPPPRAPRGMCPPQAPGHGGPPVGRTPRKQCLRFGKVHRTERGLALHLRRLGSGRCTGPGRGLSPARPHARPLPAVPVPGLAGAMATAL